MTNNNTGNLAPHSIDAEKALLGSILISPESLFEVIGFLQTDDFFIIRNAWIWDAILAVHKRNEAIDNITVIQELKARGQLETLGGSAYISEIINDTATHIHAETYGRLVERAAVRRRLLGAAQNIAKAAVDENAELSDVINHAETALFSVTERRLHKESIPINVAVNNFMDVLDQRYGVEDPEAVGLPTGYTGLDHTLGGGLEPGTLNLIAARPGLGKSALMQNIARNVADRFRKGTRTPKTVAIFSLEMTESELTRRFVSMKTNINSDRLKKGQLTPEEYGRVLSVSADMGGWSIMIDDSADLTINRLRGECRRIRRKHGLDLVIIDYLQLMIPEKKPGQNQNREQEISSISRGLKMLAMEFNIPVLAAAQLNRNVEARADKRPVLADLRDSGSLEQDADVVVFIYRDDVYDENSTRTNQADLIVSKHRGGATGTDTLYFVKEATLFANMSKSNINLLSY